VVADRWMPPTLTLAAPAGCTQRGVECIIGAMPLQQWYDFAFASANSVSAPDAAQGAVKPLTRRLPDTAERPSYTLLDCTSSRQDYCGTMGEKLGRLCSERVDTKS